MSREEQIRERLVAAFPALDGSVEIRRERRIWVGVPADLFHEVVRVAHADLGFGHLCTITGLDDGETFGFLYHLAHPEGILLNLRLSVPREAPVLPTVTDIFPGGSFYERELVDLFGVQVPDLPPGDRYPLRDDWPEGQYPLRKDWNADVLAPTISGRPLEAKDNA